MTTDATITGGTNTPALAAASAIPVTRLVGMPTAVAGRLAFGIFAVIASFGIGNLAQGNSIAAGMNDAFGVSPNVAGVVIFFAVGAAVRGSTPAPTAAVFRCWSSTERGPGMGVERMRFCSITRAPQC